MNTYTKEKFNNSLSVLVQSYLNDTLEHETCCACAVGNLVAAACGFTYQNRSIGMDGELVWDQSFAFPHWASAFCTYTDDDYQTMALAISDESKDQIDSTGYELCDLAKIEFAFEIGGRIKGTRDEKMFNGLMAVVDVLCEIHGMNEEEKQESKALFVKA
jgi:hypothetical protein